MPIIKKFISGTISLFLLITVLSQPLLARPKVECAAKTAEITIDGINQEWEGSLSVIDDEDIALSVQRDEQFLYLGVLFSGFEAQRQVLMQGMTVWFDTDGGKDEDFGIRFPKGLMDSGDMRNASRDSRPDPEEMAQAAEEYLAEADYFMILGPKKEQQTPVEFLDASDVNVRATQEEGILFYELKIPLNRTEEQPFGIGVREGKKLGIGFTTPKIEDRRSRMSGGMSGGMGGRGGMGGGGMSGGMGGMGGRGGMSRGGMGGGRGMERPDMPERLNLWIQVEDIDKALQN